VLVPARRIPVLKAALGDAGIEAVEPVARTVRLGGQVLK